MCQALGALICLASEEAVQQEFLVQGADALYSAYFMVALDKRTTPVNR